MIDCLLIGYNDTNFADYVAMVKAMGTDSGAYRDINLYYLEHAGKPHHSMDLINFFRYETEPGHQAPLHNADFLWPVITYLGTYLSKRGFSFDYVNLFSLEKEALKRKLEQGAIRTIAITTTLYVSPQPILEIVTFIRQYNSSARIIVGGPFVSNQLKILQGSALQWLLKYINADFYVNSSEGEFALTRILQALQTGASFDDIDNIAYKQGKSYVLTAASPESNALAENTVDYGLFPKEEFGEFVTLRTAKSCPFSCAFCGFPQRAGKYTYVDVGLVEQELNVIRDIGTVTTLTFLDDTFNVPKGRFKQILRMMIKNNYGFKWNSFYRSDHGDEETIALMAEAGCEGVFLGAESGSDSQLERMNKTARQKHYRKAIPLLKAAGIITHTNLIIGFPGESPLTVQETIDFIEEAQPDFFRAQLWYCDPQTPIWNHREEYGVKGSAFSWSHDTMNAQMASDLIDKMFLSTKNSIWLPQNGFELWSVFYLQRKGMKLDQIKAFLQYFNAGIKEKLTSSGCAQISSEIIEGMRVNCRF